MTTLQEEINRLRASNELYTKDYDTIFRTYMSKVEYDGKVHTIDEYVSAISIANPSYPVETINESKTVFIINEDKVEISTRYNNGIWITMYNLYSGQTIPGKNPESLGTVCTELFDTIKKHREFLVLVKELDRIHSIEWDMATKCYSLLRDKYDLDSPVEIIDQIHSEYFEIKKQGYLEINRTECESIDPEWEIEWKADLRKVKAEKKRKIAAEEKKLKKQAEKEMAEKAFDESFNKAVELVPDLRSHYHRKTYVSYGDSYHDRYYFSLAERCCFEICDYSMQHPYEVAKFISSALPLMHTLVGISKTKPQLLFLAEAKEGVYLDKNSRYLKVCSPLNGGRAVFSISLLPSASQEEIDNAMKIAADLSAIRCGISFVFRLV